MENAENVQGVDAATEAKSIAKIVDALAGLDAAAIGRVLDWAAQRYGARSATHRLRRPAPETPATLDDSGDQDSGEQEPADRYARLGELFSAANPTTEADRILVVGYWHQIKEKKEALDSQAMNKELKHIGHRVGNVTRACSALMDQSPALMIQLKKSGSSKQARKQYRLTDAGLQRVRKMLAKRGGEGSDEK